MALAATGFECTTAQALRVSRSISLAINNGEAQLDSHLGRSPE